MHNVFQATKAIYGAGSNNHTPLKSQDGTLLKDDTAIQQRRREHFELFLNRETTVVTEDTIMSIPQHPERPSLGILPIPDEVQRSTMQMKNHKAYGPDGIPAEIFKFGGENLGSNVYELTCKIWQDKQMPSDLRNIIS